MALRTGVVAVFFAVKHICHIITRFGATLTAAIDAAVADSLITSDQAVTAKNFLIAATAACEIFQAISGY